MCESYRYMTRHTSRLHVNHCKGNINFTIATLLTAGIFVRQLLAYRSGNVIIKVYAYPQLLEHATAAVASCAFSRLLWERKQQSIYAKNRYNVPRFLTITISPISHTGDYWYRIAQPSIQFLNGGNWLLLLYFASQYRSPAIFVLK